jgi:hypothetical protein
MKVRLSAEEQIETTLQIVLAIVVQSPNSTAYYFLGVHRALFNFMGDIRRKLYLV